MSTKSVMSYEEWETIQEHEREEKIRQEDEPWAVYEGENG